MDAGREALKVIYEEKQVSSLIILAKAVTLAAMVKHTTDMKKLGNHHFLSNQARINLKMALMDAGREALKVSSQGCL